MKRNKIKTWRNKVDRLFQEVGTSQTNHCESCGKQVKGLCCHHFCPKSLSNNLRYDIMNCIVLCRGCHLKHHNGDPQIYENFTNRKSADWFNHIRENRDKLISPTLGWYKKQYSTLKAIKDKL